MVQFDNSGGIKIFKAEMAPNGGEKRVLDRVSPAPRANLYPLPELHVAWSVFAAFLHFQLFHKRNGSK